MAENECYVCPNPPRAIVAPTLGGTMWGIPLCAEHLGTGSALLLRMFGNDPELESACEIFPMGVWELLPAPEHKQGDDRG